jgi:fumarate hydratase subunit beta
MKTIIMNTPFTEEKIASLKCGDKVLISGTIYTARDQAHKRLVTLLEGDEELPFTLKDSVIYYTGPILAQPPNVFTSAGPTTSSRMDSVTPILLDNGLRGMIGKGPRSQEVVESIKKNKAIYLSAVGGAGAYLATKIIGRRLIAFPDLGTEAVYEITVKDFPCYVAIDIQGNILYE